MEDILGIIAFIAFLVFRAMGDRKKGMQKNGEKKVAKPQPVNKPYVAMERKQLEYQPLKPAFVPLPKVEQLKPSVVFNEGESAYDNLAIMEGSEPVYETEGMPGQAGEENITAGLGWNYDAADLRKAVMWSEVLRIPKCRSRYGQYYNHGR